MRPGGSANSKACHTYNTPHATIHPLAGKMATYDRQIICENSM